MQTFVPFADCNKSASVLDYQRLGKQRVEAYQILNTILSVSNGWATHPAVKMWKGHERFLFGSYLPAIVNEWVRRGYYHSPEFSAKIAALSNSIDASSSAEPPSWWGGPIHASHRRALLFKKPEHYGQFGWSDVPEEPKTTYHWPV